MAPVVHIQVDLDHRGLIETRGNRNVRPDVFLETDLSDCHSTRDSFQQNSAPRKSKAEERLVDGERFRMRQDVEWMAGCAGSLINSYIIQRQRIGHKRPRLTTKIT